MRYEVQIDRAFFCTGKEAAQVDWKDAVGEGEGDGRLFLEPV